MAKASHEKSPEELQEEQKIEEDIKHQQKREEIDMMKEEQRKKAARMERINPRTNMYPDFTSVEVQAIEAELPEDFTDEQIEEVVKAKGFDQRRETRKQIRKEREEKRRKQALDEIQIQPEPPKTEPT